MPIYNQPDDTISLNLIPDIDNSSVITVNHDSIKITQLYLDLHLTISEYLDSKSMRALRETCTIFSRNISTISVQRQALREALRMNSTVGNNHVTALLEMGATLPLAELANALREVLRMNSTAGDNHAYALLEMGATLPLAELANAVKEAYTKALRTNGLAGDERVTAVRKMGATLLPPAELANARREAFEEVLSKEIIEKAYREVLRESLGMNSATGNNHANALRSIGVTLPPAELANALREALRMNSIYGNNHVTTLREMGATLPPAELANALKEALRMNSTAGNNHVNALREMGATLPPAE